MRLLDILIATLVLFPWVTEGQGIDIPGLHLADLSDLALPLLAASLVVLGVSRWPRGVWSASFFAGQGMRLAQAGRNALERSLARALWSAVAGLAALFFLGLLWRYWAFDNPGFGFGVLIWKATHGTGAVIAVGLIGAALQRWSGEPWEKSFFLRQAMTLWRFWLSAVARSAGRALWTAAGAVGALFLWVSLARHWAFESHGYDLGIFTNAIWNLTQGNGYVSSIKGGINLFSDHQSPLFWALAPLFWLVPRPETLLFAQAFGLVAGGPALFYLARTRFGRGHWAPAALPCLYWAWLPLRNANAFEFHPEVFMLPLFLWAFAAFASERRWVRGLGVLAFVGALGAKESAPVVALGLGIAWALTNGANSWRDRWPGVALAAAGLVVFFFDVKVVPRIFGGDYAYMGLYERFGGGIGDLLLAPLTQPAYFFSEILNYDRLNFLFWTLAPLGFLPLFCWRAAVAVLPPYLMLFLTEGNQRVQVFYHYGIEPGSALFWALPFGLAEFARRFGWKRAGTWMLVWAVGAHGPTEVSRTRSYDRFPHAAWLAAEVLPCLNTEAATAASDSLIPHLATRSWISYSHHLQQRPSGDPVRCVVTDLSLSNWSLEKVETRRVIMELPGQGYREAWRCHDFRVYELETSGCLRCVPKCY